ncbi:MAG: dag [Herbinix sp.]|jgi:N-acyl-D-amino-acid deacylase|nr:dag [Herbinix sp.]
MLDLAINNGTVIDTVSLQQRAFHIGIKKGKIVELSKEPLCAQIIIDAQNLIVSPGFIDPHGHIDGYEYSYELSACQGITTTVGGNCGLSPINISEFFAKEDQKGCPINQAELIGHSFSLRKAVGIKDVYQKAEKDQIQKMKELAQKALADGACGISLGLDYSPGASFEEILTLAQVCAEYNRILPVHTRLFTSYDMNSLYEVLEISKRTGVKLLISHFVYQYGEGIMEEALSIVDKAIAQGIPVTIDSGMYTDWATAIGTATFDEQVLKDNSVAFSHLIVATGEYYGNVLNREIYTKLRTSNPNESIICRSGHPDSVYQCLKKSYCIPSTDIGNYKQGEGHPQIAGTFPKYIKEMVRERKELSLEEAIAKATLLPAQLFGFLDKGKLEIGADADITIFDYYALEDKARFPGEGFPDAKPKGIPYVIVNGELVVDNCVYTGRKAGKNIRFL